MASGGKTAQPYGFAPEFERAVAYLAGSDARFLARTAHEIDPELMALPECKLAVTEAKLALKENGRGPGDFRVIVQRCARRREEGKVTHETVQEVAAILDAFDEKPSAENYEAELVEVLKARIRLAIAETALTEYRKDNWKAVEALLTRERALGRAEVGLGVVASPEGAYGAIDALQGAPRISWGIQELDDVTGGGQLRGTLACFMAGAGGGKSMALSHIMAQLSRQQLHGVYATLEIAPAYVLSRYAACLTGIPINTIQQGKNREETYRRWLAENPTHPQVQAFPAQVTTVNTLKQWVREVEEQRQAKMDYIIVDYADLLTNSGKPDEKGMYSEMRLVYESLRLWCEAEGYIGLTASQTRGRDERKKGKLADLQDIADSSNKGRILDLLISINLDDETRENTFLVAKNRHGEGRAVAGPVPTNYAMGQIAPVSRTPMPAAMRRALNKAARVGAAVQQLTGDLGIGMEAALTALEGA